MIVSPGRLADGHWAIAELHTHELRRGTLAVTTQALVACWETRRRDPITARS